MQVDGYKFMHDIKSNPDNKADVTGSGENRSVLPSLSFPKDGGAIRGMGRSFPQIL